MENYNSFVYNMSDNRPNQTDSKSNDVTIAVFFDGTSNNRYNVNARNAYQRENAYNKKKGEISDAAQGYKNKHGADDSSYENDPTNVERLFDNYDLEKIYQEGAGTTSTLNENNKIEYGKDDWFQGNGFGYKENGLRAKVRQACDSSAKKIRKKKPKKLSQINFNLFGFSRGAAEARNFVYEVTRLDGIDKLIELDDADIQKYVYKIGIPKFGFLGFFLKQNGFKIEVINNLQIQINFVGIFDTVASYNPKFTLTPNFEKHAIQLNLNAVSKAKKIVHFTAANEHRKNFALSPINHLPTKHIEFSLPGVHSDIGGSYLDDATEEIIIEKKSTINLNTSFNKIFLEEKQNLVNQGWYTLLNNLSVKVGPLVVELWATRKHLSQKYSFISLRFMYRFANEYQPNMFNEYLPKNFKYPEPSKKNINSLHEYLNDRFDQWMQVWEDEDKQLLLYPDRSSYSNLYAHRKIVLIEEINVNLHINQEGTIEFCLHENDALGFIEKRLEKFVFGNEKPLIFKTSESILQECGFELFSYHNLADSYNLENIKKHIPTIIEEIIEQIYLRQLRNRFLHYSAHWGGFKDPHQPNIGKIREIY